MVHGSILNSLILLEYIDTLTYVSDIDTLTLTFLSIIEKWQTVPHAQVWVATHSGEYRDRAHPKINITFVSVMVHVFILPSRPR